LRKANLIAAIQEERRPDCCGMTVVIALRRKRGSVPRAIAAYLVKGNFIVDLKETAS
jgi:hypothetical protein